MYALNDDGIPPSNRPTAHIYAYISHWREYPFFNSFQRRRYGTRRHLLSQFRISIIPKVLHRSRHRIQFQGLNLNLILLNVVESEDCIPSWSPSTMSDGAVRSSRSAVDALATTASRCPPIDTWTVRDQWDCSWSIDGSTAWFWVENMWRVILPGTMSIRGWEEECFAFNRYHIIISHWVPAVIHFWFLWAMVLKF